MQCSLSLARRLKRVIVWALALVFHVSPPLAARLARGVTRWWPQFLSL